MTRSQRRTTIPTFTNSACNSLTTERSNVSKTAEFHGKTPHSRLAATPDFIRKTPFRDPEIPTPHATPHKKVE